MNKTYEERWLKNHYMTLGPRIQSGYLLTNGFYIDLVSKGDVDRGAWYRDDHRSICHVFNSPICESGYDCMIRFMARGNIRFSPECGGFDMIKEPTREQWEAMQQYSRNKYFQDDKEIRFEVSDKNGRILFHSERLSELREYWYRRNHHEQF